MIMELENQEKWEKAGKITAEALEYGKSLVKTDALLLDVAEKIEQKIISLGGMPAFPVNISMNHIAAHYTPEINDTLKFNDEIVKLDIGVHVDGCIGDSAVTVDLSKQNSDLVKASENALNSALKLATPGTKLRIIGEAINSEITSLGFQPIVNLSGHSLDVYNLHAGLTVPNFDNGDNTELEEGMTIAVEPFATNGSGMIVDTSNPNIFSFYQKKPVRSIYARTFLQQTVQYKELPFAKRWVKMPLLQLNLALKELVNLSVLNQYPPLVEQKKGLVSQAEHSLIVKDNPLILTK
jgi:methionyl aminopeptidase